MHPLRPVLAALAAGVGMLLCGPATAQEPRKPTEEVIQRIGDCLASGKEAVLLTAGFECLPRRTGAGFLRRRPDTRMMPFDVDEQAVCAKKGPDSEEYGVNDLRRLPGDVVKTLAARQNKPAPSGIRIIGAIFCETVDLFGLDVPYSVVLDRSYFKFGIDARNFRTKGDLSVDESLMAGTLRLTRARVDGALFGDAAMIGNVIVEDTQIQGSVSFQKSMLFFDVYFDRVAINGDLSVRDSAFTFFRVQSARIGGALDLNQSETRCGYHVKKSDIGYMMVEDAGFGVLAPIEADGAAVSGQGYPWWSKSKGFLLMLDELHFGGKVRRMINAEIEEVRKQVEISQDGAGRQGRRLNGCEKKTTSANPEFAVNDNKIHFSMCIRSFQWMAPHVRSYIEDPKYPDNLTALDQLSTTVLALNSTSIGGNLIINLWGDRVEIHDRVGREKHRFESIGLTARALIFDFKDTVRPYHTYIDGLQFERVYTADISCEYHDERPAPAIDAETVRSRTATFREVTSQVELPSVDHVMAWLDRNQAPTTQPFAAFIEAYQRAGADTTGLRIARATTELCARTLQLFTSGKSCSYEQNWLNSLLGAIAGAFHWLLFAVLATLEFFATIFRWLLWPIAGHGYRPIQVVPAIGLLLLGFWFYLRMYLGVVAFKPKRGTRLRPVSFLFLFDRMTPLYRIMDEHYNIAAYYKPAPAKIGSGKFDPKSVRKVTYLGHRREVVPAKSNERDLVEKRLVILRVLGIVLTVFLLAALNALILR